MRKISPTNGHLSAFERAVCYYTLPKVTSSVTVGLIGAYLACFFEAVALLCYGVVAQDARYVKWGLVAVAGIVILGLVAFTGRALLSEVKRRKTMRLAKTLPDVSEQATDLPDPFADHLLVRRPFGGKATTFACTDNAGNPLYSAASGKHGRQWVVTGPEGAEALRVRASKRPRSFSIWGGMPSRLTVYAGPDEVARFRRRFSLSGPCYTIDCLRPEPKRYLYRSGGFFDDKRLVGRIYNIRGWLYLDVENTESSKAFLALFVSIS